MYDTVVVFPPPEVEKQSTSHQYTLPAGNHKFRFDFVLPQFTSCQQIKQPGGLSISRFVIDSSGIDYARDSKFHIQAPLPPSLSDMKKVASVRYFLKATVNRASFMKMNLRIYQPFVFLTADDDAKKRYDPQEIRFARRQFTLTPTGISSNQDQPGNPQGKKEGAFKSLRAAFSSSRPSMTYNGPSVLFEMRFPQLFNPTASCPARLYFISQSDPRLLPMQSLIVNELILKLYAVTDTRAQNYTKRYTHSLTLMEETNLNIELPFSEFTETNLPNLGKVWEAELPNSIWEKVAIPGSVAPSFQICNIARSYAFEAIVGISPAHGVRPNYVSVSGDIVLLSGLTSNSFARSNNEFPAPPLPKRPAGKADEAFADNKGMANQQPSDEPDAPSDLPPSYNEVITSELQSPNASSSAPPANAANAAGTNDMSNRRTYHQTNDYYSNLDQFDVDTKN